MLTCIKKMYEDRQFLKTERAACSAAPGKIKENKL